MCVTEERQQPQYDRYVGIMDYFEWKSLTFLWSRRTNTQGKDTFYFILTNLMKGNASE